MSRGFGRVERAILDIVSTGDPETAWSAETLAEMAGVQVRSARRAARNLAAGGHIDEMMPGETADSAGNSPEYIMFARLPELSVPLSVPPDSE